jgi:hypothetical protein
MKIALTFFGVVPRSIRYTYESIRRNIIVPLKQEFGSDIAVSCFNINTENALVDGVKTNHEDVKIVEYDHLCDIKQSFIDKMITEMGCWQIQPNFTNNYDAETFKNCFRQLYIEREAGAFLEQQNFDLALVCGADYFIGRKIDLNQVYDCLNGEDFLYSTNIADAGGGYTNGFYFGRRKLIIKILKRLDDKKEIFPIVNYELYLKKSFEMNNIKRKVADMVFFKIRANKNVNYRIDQFGLIENEQEKNQVTALFNEVQKLRLIPEEALRSTLKNGLWYPKI